VDHGEKTRVVLRRNSRQQKKKEYFFYRRSVFSLDTPFNELPFWLRSLQTYFIPDVIQQFDRLTIHKFP